MGQTDHNHTHSHAHSHSHHHHSDDEVRAISNRLARAIGHLNAVKRMVENKEDCTEVIVQLSAVKAAINSTGKYIIKSHIEHCITDAVEENDLQAIEDITRAIDRFI